ncbi:MAG: DMT family transporter [Phycisphaerales bacterium]|nr:DMT family transporter [Phycisphaerales bacterium]
MIRVFCLLALITMIAGVTPIAARMALDGFPPMTMAWFRFGSAGFLLWLTLRCRKKRLDFRREDLPMLIGLALICVPINQYGFLVGIKKANASHAGLFYALAPVLVFWISLLFRKTTYNHLMLVAALLAAAGAGCVIWPSFRLGCAWTGGTLVGDLLLLLAIVSWALFVVLSKPLISRFGALKTLTAVFLLGTLLHTPFVCFDLHQLDIRAARWTAWAGFAYITGVTCYVNYLLIYLVLARYEATRAMIVVNGSFLITVFVEWLAFREPLTRYFFYGTVLILVAISLDVLRGLWSRKDGSVSSD